MERKLQNPEAGFSEQVDDVSVLAANICKFQFHGIENGNFNFDIDGDEPLFKFGGVLADILSGTFGCGGG